MTKVRAEAQRLVDEGAVIALVRTSSSTYAIVLEGNKHYATKVYVNGHFTCGCDWGKAHSRTDNLCVHALAVRLAAEEARETR